jgi:hypothetical protein
VGFELTISAREQPQTHALDRAATGTGFKKEMKTKNKDTTTASSFVNNNKNNKYYYYYYFYYYY